MTTSYDAETVNSGSAMPGRDAEGMQTWNPSVGIYHKPAKKKRESYGGIIAALQDDMVRAGTTVKSYPENFAGIIAAIQDLTAAEFRPGSDIGPKPPGGDINIDINGFPIWIEGDTQNGQLWFDTRQGRLFVWVDDDWYQTNGADGVPIITEDAAAPAIENVVPGQFWWNRGENALYIFDGTYILPDNTITTNPNAGGAPVWKLVVDSDGEGNNALLQTTATLPLSVVGPRVTALEDYEYLPDPGLSEGLMTVQKDFNEWVFQALVNLDKGLEDHQPVYVGETPPLNTLEDPLPAGTLWYDTESLELSIWYLDDDNGQWVPTSVAHTYDEDLDVIRASVASESRQRNIEIHALQERLNSIDISDAAEITAISARLLAIEADIKALPTVDLDPYVQQTTFDNTTIQFNGRIHALETAAPAYTPAMADALERSLLAVIDTKASTGQLAAVEASIPDVSSFATQAYVGTAIGNITTDFLPRNGGTVRGSFKVEKQDYALPAFDMSGASWHSRDAFKLAANAPVDGYTSTFGTTDAMWEYAWKFDQNEDFCWIYNDTNKVFSITKDGPACSTLVLGDFSANDNNGRVIHNKIDVKERLNTYQAAFEQMRQGVSNATDFDSLKANILSALASV